MNTQAGFVRGLFHYAYITANKEGRKALAQEINIALMRQRLTASGQDSAFQVVNAFRENPDDMQAGNSG